MNAKFVKFSCLILLLLAFIAVGCKRSTAKAPKQMRIMLDWMQNPNHIPLFVGSSLGYFQEEGILLDIAHPESPDSLHLLEAGHADFALSYLPLVLRACAKDREFFVVGKVIETPLNGFLFLKESGIKEPDDFNGRTVGYCPTAACPLSLEVLLDEKDIQVGSKIPLGYDLISDLASKNVDVVYGAFKNIEPEHLKVLGYNPRFLLVTEFGVPEYEEVVVVTNGAHIRNKKLISCFQKALQKSIDFCKASPEKAFELYKSDITNPKSILWQQKSWTVTFPMLATNQNFSYTKVKTLADWLQDKGLMGKSIRLDPLFGSMVKQEPNN